MEATPPTLMGKLTDPDQPIALIYPDPDLSFLSRQHWVWD